MQAAVLAAAGASGTVVACGAEADAAPGSSSGSNADFTAELAEAARSAGLGAVSTALRTAEAAAVAGRTASPSTERKADAAFAAGRASRSAAGSAMLAQSRSAPSDIMASTGIHGRRIAWRRWKR